jgi:hypothetical protein
MGCYMGKGQNELACLEIRGDAHVHVAKVLADVGCSGPFPGLGEGVTFIFSRVPELDKGVFCGWVGRHVDE